MKKLFAFIITTAILATMAAPTFAQRRRRVESQSYDSRTYSSRTYTSNRAYYDNRAVYDNRGYYITTTGTEASGADTATS